MIESNQKKKKVFVAMSGGVDSSVAAVLLKEQGCDVTGVTMRFDGYHVGMEEAACFSNDCVVSARAICEDLDIPHQVFDFTGIFREGIIGNFIKEYLNGQTPNPCVRCNRMIKFGALLEKSLAMGADYFATGHYARIVYDEEVKKRFLKKGIDDVKDQAYFLYGIHGKNLNKILFPLGDLTKLEVRGLAKKFSLIAAERPESQDICFIQNIGYRGYLKKMAGTEAFTPGPFKDQNGEIVGQHEGIGFYTIGQRERLGIALGFPAYVFCIDSAENTIYVGPRECLLSEGLIARDAQLLALNLSQGPVDVMAQIRYHARAVPAQVSLDGECIRVEFETPQESVTPGQSVVFFDDDIVLGGAIIEKAIKEN